MLRQRLIRNITCVLVALGMAAPGLAQTPHTTQAGTRASQAVALTGAYGLYSFLVPGKRGGQLTYLHDSQWTWEVEYFEGDIGLELYELDFATIAERLMLIKLRKFWSSSFNLTTGLGERRFTAEIGDTITDRIPADRRPGQTQIEVHRMIWMFGLGNRWHFPSGFTVGVDWLEVGWPFGAARTRSAVVEAFEDEEDRNSAERVVSYLQYLPTFHVAKAYIGFAF